MEFLGEGLAIITGVGGVVIGAVGMLGRVKKAKKEVMEVVALVDKFVAKYGEVDDDAKLLKAEVMEAVAAVKGVLKF